MLTPMSRGAFAALFLVSAGASACVVEPLPDFPGLAQLATPRVRLVMTDVASGRDVAEVELSLCGSKLFGSGGEAMAFIDSGGDARADDRAIVVLEAAPRSMPRRARVTINAVSDDRSLGDFMAIRRSELASSYASYCCGGLGHGSAVCEQGRLAHLACSAPVETDDARAARARLPMASVDIPLDPVRGGSVELREPRSGRPLRASVRVVAEYATCGSWNFAAK